MHRIIISKETSQIAMVIGCKCKNGDNLNNIRHETSRHFRNKKLYLKDRINELATGSKNNRGINYFKRGYQPRSNLVKDVQAFEP
jgi:hypothetical protein